MLGKPIRLFSVFGFTVRIDATWFILLLLITSSLAMGLFPSRYPGLTMGTYWMMGMVGALGLFVSILIHEIAHSLVAKRFGLEMKGITLFLLGGMAEMPREPSRAKVEFWMAIAGPLTSLALAAAFYGIYRGGLSLDWPPFWNGIFGYLAIVNVVLAVFNLVPAFPLDGGRVLRSILWQVTRDFGRATRIAAATGSAFGIVLLVFGTMRVIVGDVVGGIWWMLIGIFIRSAALASVQQLAISRFLAHEKVADLMNPRPVTVPMDIPVRRLVEDYLYRYDHHVFPVLEGDRLAGCVGLARVKNLSSEAWDARRVADVMERCPAEDTIAAEVPAEEALRRMQDTGRKRLLVVDSQGSLRGIVTASDLLHHLAVKMELDRPVAAPLPA